ncbi:MAG TPA: hypothetical protein DEP42_00875 [Ruminococcaceae bacterium]|nr:hypothetical protein [Oscillospiraceae bacterium]
MKQYDLVRLLTNKYAADDEETRKKMRYYDDPSKNLVKGSIGVIVEDYVEGYFLVEFPDPDSIYNCDIATVSVRRDEVELAE